MSVIYLGISIYLYLIPFKMYSKKKNRGYPFYRQHGTASTSLEQKVKKVEIASLRCMLMPRWRISGCRFSTALNKDVIACYWVSCAIFIREVFSRLHVRCRRHTFASLWGACLPFASLWRAYSCGDSCVLGVHLRSDMLSKLRKMIF